ncbi:xanthine dehydrogenase accessory protein XdhC [Salinarimonas ramus]|uniref:Xanthine dehydrogenase accessory protein XdhC n=1 Tax=Salinarimonas ramus TaxID=690164 RepID=A0A917V4U3_9HYPH|nr:xanthine dehydrogenase accessory protein XdhC [Salinarimonas ramus]GGK36845.1 xanthine dehydrogenase accessory protein XdhC [Salinarimonas ramus]
MTSAYVRLADLVQAHGAAALVRVADVRGSAPREVGAAMAVRADGAFLGTIGGGELEWRALAAARAALAEGRGPMRRLDMALGPNLGQCCGGRAIVTVETFDARDLEQLRAMAQAAAEGRPLTARLDEDGRVARARIAPRRGAGPSAARTGGGETDEPSPPPVGSSSRRPPLRGGVEPGETWIEDTGPRATPLLLFGAGHVGRALVLALAPLPFAIRWIDTRADAFPAHVPANAKPVHTDEPGLEIARAAPGTFVLVMTHSHPLDLALTAQALGRADLPHVGLIGSATKRARFEKRFREIGLPEARIAALACPIGVPGIAGKDPAIIAAATAAALLQAREQALPAASTEGPA